MSRLTLFLLGPPRIERDGAPVKLSRRKAVALLAYLAVTGQSHSRDALATQFWPEFDQSRARASLRNVLADLKKALGEGWLDIDQETVRLYGEAEVWLDVVEFQDRLAECRTHGHPPDRACPACLPLLTDAATLYRDDFLAGFTLRDSPGFDEWQFFQTEGLRHELAGVLERLARWHGAQGEYEPAIAYARHWVVLDPLHEPAHRCLMQLYAWSGQHAAAWRQYRECVRVLEEELGVPPSDETTALHERIRAERARPPEREAAPLAPTPQPPIPPHLPAFLTEASEPVAVERPVFVARERELARLSGHLRAVLAGQGQVVLITGGPGRGKTALMREFARRSMETYPDLLVAGGNCNAYSGIGDPYLPFREVMAMLTGDVEARWAAGTIAHDHARRLWAALPLAAQALVDHGPSLIDAVLPGPALLSRAAAAVSEGTGWLGQLKALVGREKASYSDLEQRALFEQLTNVLRTLAEAHPLLLTLDDVQWADNGSISLLFHLGRRLEGGRILVVCAYRPAEVAGGRHGERHPLESVLTEFKRRFGEVWVNLRQADEMEGRRFVNAFLDTEPNRLGEDFRRGLFHHTGGHPLFTIELLRAMQARGDLIRDEGGRWAVTPALDWRTLPVRVEAAIEARIGRLSDELREVLAVASVEGERFTAQVVARVQGIPEREVLRALSQELEWRYRLVEEEQEVQIDGRFLSRYRFAHALFQQYLYNGLSAGERRLLHGEIGDALEEIYQHQSHDIAVQLTHHYAEAGRREKTIEYSLRAGDQACLAYANEEATDYYSRALALLDEPAPLPSRKDWRLEALKGLGQVYFGMGEVAQAEERFREAISLGREMGLAPRELVRLYYWLGEVLWWRQSRYDDLFRLAGEGLALLGADTESVEAALMNHHLAIGHWFKGNWKRFRELTYQRAQFIPRLPYSEELRPAYHTIVFVACTYDKDVEEAMKWVQTLEEEASSHHDLRALGEARWLVGMILLLTGDLCGAISRSQQAMELYTRIGDDKHRGWGPFVMGEAFLSLGDLQKAEEYACRGLETAKAVGNKHDLALTYWLLGRIFLSQRAGEKAVEALQEAVQLKRELRWGLSEARAISALGRQCLAQGDRVGALRRFQETLALVEPEELRGFRRQHQHHWSASTSPFVASVVSGLEEAHEDSEAFRAFCRRFREEHPEAGDSPFTQWFLEPGTVRAVRGPPLQLDEFVVPLLSDWVWQDPFGDCAFTVQNGLEIHAANGRNLWYLNLSAPRMLQQVSGDWAVQTICVPASEERPAIGGLVLWKDKENYLRLDRGTIGEHEILFAGCLGNQDIVIGRGRLRESADQQVSKSPGRVFLRLERIGDRVDALCSADGENWFTVGGVAFPVEDPVQVGLHAIGSIDRAVYRGAHPDGTAVRFASFQLWGLNH